jgi:hypothetical protein
MTLSGSLFQERSAAVVPRVDEAAAAGGDEVGDGREVAATRDGIKITATAH